MTTSAERVRLGPSGTARGSVAWAHQVIRWCRSVGVDPHELPGETFPYVDIVLWAESLHNTPTVEVIRARWQIDRSDAYRWLSVLVTAHREARKGGEQAAA